MDDWKSLQLDEDEAEHYRQVAGEAQRNLSLANDAAVLTLTGLAAFDSEMAINEPKGFGLLLMAKCAQNIRFAATGLMLGYYSGASAVLRSALEALEYAALFHSEPGQVAQWLRNEFSSRPQGELDLLRREQSRAARKALLDQEKDRRAVEDARNEFWQAANEHMHPTLKGLAEEFGVEIEYLAPHDLEEAYQKAGENFDKALELYVMLSRYGTNVLPQRERTHEMEGDTLEIRLAGRYHEPTLEDLALFASYIAHRLLDAAYMDFHISDEDFVQGYKAWHKALREPS